MNAMSVSPVKPSINPGNHAIPTTATNLSKNPPPSSNNFAPINLVPENKPVPAIITTPANTENSVDLCSKPPPTSNGTVSPLPESSAKECHVNLQQNHSENCDTAENLSTTDNPPPKPVEDAADVKNVAEIKPKLAEAKSATPTKENSEPVKEAAKETVFPKVETIKETSKVEESSPSKQGKKDEPAKGTEERSPSKQPEASFVKSTECGSVTEPKKEEPPITETKPTVDEVKEEKAAEVKENIEKKVQKPEDVKPDPPAESTPAPPKTTKRKAKQPVEQVDEDSNEGRKSKRVRLPTQPYQSPIPELQFIAKLQAPAKTTPKPPTEKIIAFYKNEFLAVRNPEGSFYICQTFQNIHKSSSRIKIRWFTNLPQDIFTPDFCDHTEFDCILTNVQMTRVEKDRWKLPDYERTRIENILKRALDVEKGVVDKPSITEEHPDGLDLSLFKDEAQLSKKKRKKKKSASPNAKTKVEKPKKQPPKPTKATKPPPVSTKKSARLSNLSQTPAKEVEKTKPAEVKVKKGKKKTKHAAKKSPNKLNDKSNTKVWEPSVKSSNSSKVVLSLKKETKPETTTTTTTTTKTATKRTSAVSSRASANSNASIAPPKRKRDADKSAAAAANQPTSAERSGKVRNAGSAVTAKINSAAMRTTKDKEHKASNSSGQRKK